MSVPRAIEEAYARLDQNEKRMWKRAAAAAQNDQATPLERNLALDVTALLMKVSAARQALAIPMPPATG